MTALVLETGFIAKPRSAPTFLRKLRSSAFAMILTIAIGATAVMPQKAEATGFPTVDIVALIQRILGYITQLEDEASNLTTSVSSISELMQMYQDYQQTMTQYQQFLQQVRGLQAFLSPSDWNQLMGALAPYYGQSALAGVPMLDYKSSTFDQDVKTALATAGYAIDYSPSDFANAIANTTLTDSSVYAAQNAQVKQMYQVETDRRTMTSANKEAYDTRTQTVQQYGEKIQNLGDESDVATLQMIATELATSLEYQNETMNTLNQLLSTQDSQMTMRAADQATNERAEMQRLAKIKNKTYTTPSFQMVFN